MYELLRRALQFVLQRFLVAQPGPHHSHLLRRRQDSAEKHLLLRVCRVGHASLLGALLAAHSVHFARGGQSLVVAWSWLGVAVVDVCVLNRSCNQRRSHANRFRLF